MTVLWHFTCDHAAARIGRRGLLIPQSHPLMPNLGPVVWLTDDPAPNRDDLGFSSMYLFCDRMVYRYRAQPANSVRWLSTRDRVAPSIRADVEAFSRPSSWWLAFEDTPARLA